MPCKLIDIFCSICWKRELESFVSDRTIQIREGLLSFVKDWLNFTRNKTVSKGMKYHYLRIGNASPLYDRLVQTTMDLELEWVQHEAEAFRNYHFSPSYNDFEAAIVNMVVENEQIADLRKDFWEYFIWKTEKFPLPVVIVIPNSSKYGSLTPAEIHEALSLIRLTDRAWQVFENKTDVESEITSWLISISTHVHRKERIELEGKKDSSH